MTVERPVNQLIKSQNLKRQQNKYNFNPSQAKEGDSSGMQLLIFTSKPVTDIKKYYPLFSKLHTHDPSILHM